MHRAAPPSLIWLALPAVTVPSLASKTGRSLPSDSAELSARIPSSAATPGLFLSRHCSPVRATISFLKYPLCVALAASWWLRAENLSCSARLTSCALAMKSAALPMAQHSKAQRRPSYCMWSSKVTGPNLGAPAPSRIFAKYGAPVMLSNPPANTSELSPALMLWAACITACRPLPHTLLTVTQLVVSGRPAFRAAWRAGFCPSPACSTQPMTTSSTFPDSPPRRERDSPPACPEWHRRRAAAKGPC